MAMEDVVRIGLHFHFYRLTRSHLGKLGLHEVGHDPDRIGHHGQQRLADLYIGAPLRAQSAM
jgi:hypothetical protein